MTDPSLTRYEVRWGGVNGMYFWKGFGTLTEAEAFRDSFSREWALPGEAVEITERSGVSSKTISREIKEGKQ